MSSLVWLFWWKKYRMIILCWKLLFSKASREPSPDPSAEEAASEKEQSVEKNKQEKNVKPKEVRD